MAERCNNYMDIRLGWYYNLHRLIQMCRNSEFNDILTFRHNSCPAPYVLFYTVSVSKLTSIH